MGGRGAAFEGRSYIDAVKNAEDDIKGDSVEIGIVLDAKGRIIFKKSDNSTNSVSFTVDELAKMRGMTFTHNHPRGNTFSVEDVSLATQYGLKVIRATSNKRTYQLKLQKATQKAADFASDYNKAISANRKTIDKAYDKYANALRNGTITLSEFNDTLPKLNARFNKLNSDWLKNNAKTYGYKYSVVEKRR